jgi:PAS domain-containing protein
MTRIFALLALALVLTGCALIPDRASAATSVGISDQDYADFTTPLFKQANFKRVRYIARWDVARKPGHRGYFDKYVEAANANGIELFVTFGTPLGQRCPRRPCRLPGVGAYKRAFRAFRKRWPSVRTIAPWNEANHRSQPTWKKPKRAAQYFNAVRRNCRGCRIVAADVIDEANMVPWLKVFKRHAHGERLWGLHNYKDTNPRRGQTLGGTRRLLRTVRGPVWLTETGGIVAFRLPGGKRLFGYNEARASRALKRMFRLARRYRGRIKRVYVYDWQQPRRKNRFDSGLLRKDGSPRPGYHTVKNHLAKASFNP